MASLSIGMLMSGGAFPLVASLTGTTSVVVGRHCDLFLTVRSCRCRFLTAPSSGSMPKYSMSMMATTPEHGMRGECDHR